MDRDNKYKDDIIQAARLILDFTNGMSLENFKTDKKTQAAVIRELEIMGEASKRLSETFKNQYNLPWRDIAGFRDKAIHDYMLLELETVWDVVEKDIPEFLEIIK